MGQRRIDLILMSRCHASSLERYERISSQLLCTSESMRVSLLVSCDRYTHAYDINPVNQQFIGKCYEYGSSENVKHQLKFGLCVCHMVNSYAYHAQPCECFVCPADSVLNAYACHAYACVRAVSVVLTVCCADVIELVRLLFNTLTVAMRFEPANARFFVTEVCAFCLFNSARDVDEMVVIELTC